MRSLIGSPTSGPAFKNRIKTKVHVVLIDESALFLNPTEHRRLVSEGGGLRFWMPMADIEKKMSVIGGIGVSPDSRGLGFYFATKAEGF